MDIDASKTDNIPSNVYEMKLLFLNFMLPKALEIIPSDAAVLKMTIIISYIYNLLILPFSPHHYTLLA